MNCLTLGFKVRVHLPHNAFDGVRDVLIVTGLLSSSWRFSSSQPRAIPRAH